MDYICMLHDFEAPDFPSYWVDCVNQGRLDDLISLYHKDAILIPTFLPNVVKDEGALEKYFTELSSKEGMQVILHENTIDCLEIEENIFVTNGMYDFKFEIDGISQIFPSRFTFVLDLHKESPVLHHHSSQAPTVIA